MQLKFLLLIVCAVLFFSCRQQPKTWVAIGDSITYLNDHTDETGHRVHQGYLSRVTDSLTGYTYVNKGYNGWTAKGIAEKFDELQVPVAEVYSVFLGTNDWWAGLPVGSMNDYSNNHGTGSLYGSFRIILDKIKALNPAAKIVLIAPMQRSDFVYINDPTNNAWGSYRKKNDQSLEAFAKTVTDIAAYENVPVLDLYHLPGLGIPALVKFKRLKDPETGAYRNYAYPDYIDVPFNPETDEYPYPPEAMGMTYDGLHPSDEGNARIVAELLALLRKH